MPTCGRCSGEGYVSYDEDGRRVRDACYHCGTSGVISEEEAHADRLQDVATFLAHLQVSERREACQSDPDAEDWDLCAAENGLSEYDYFRCRVWDRAEDIAQQLAELDHTSQQVLIAWMLEPAIPRKPTTTHVHSPIRNCDDDSDDIPF
jgi:hypothetical protein